MYTILITDNNDLIATEKSEITQFSNLVNNIKFLCSPNYYNEDMSSYDTVILEYITPLTKSYRREALVLSNERYKDYLQYILPLDSKITAEYGYVEMQITFKKTDISSETKSIENKIRKTKLYRLKIEAVENWNNYTFDVSENSINSTTSDVINDQNISNDSTYSSQKIEDNFIDNTELDKAFDENIEIIYSEDQPINTTAKTWFKVIE